MEHIIHNLSLNMQSSISQVSLSVKKGDTKRKLCITLTENGKVYRIPKGCVAVFSAKKDNGGILYNDCTIKGNTIVYEFTEQTANVPGKMDCEIKLYDANNALITSPQFTIIVNGVVYEDDEVEDSNEFSALDQLVAETIAVNAELNRKLANGKLDFANAIKGTAAGEAVVIDDISPAEHIVRCKVHGKNLIPTVTEESAGLGITWTVDVNDGGIIANGTGTGNAYLTLVSYSNQIVQLKKGKAYTLLCVSELTSSKGYVYLQNYVNGSPIGGVSVSNGSATFVPTEDGYASIGIVLLSGVKFTNEKMLVQFEEGNTATSYEPYIDPTTVTVTEETTGATYIPNADGTCNVVSVSPTMTLSTDNADVTIECEYNRDISAVFADLLSRSRISYIDLLASKWQGEQSPYSQVVAVEGATENSQVDLTPSVEQLSIFHNKDLAFVTENEDGIVTVYAIGQKPANDYTIQVTITEVVR